MQHVYYNLLNLYDMKASYVDMDDARLASSFADGDNSAMTEIFRRYHSRVRSYVFSFVRNEALVDDICQLTFIKLSKSLRCSGYRETGLLKSFLFTIAANLVKDEGRKSHALSYIDNIESLDSFDDDDEASVMEHNLQIMRDCLSALSDEQRSVVVSYVYGEKSFKEIAEDSGLSINTVLGRMHLAKLKTKKIMLSKAA